MNRGPIGRRREYSSGRQKLVKIISNPLKPRVLCCLKRRKLTRKRIAHGRVSAPASDLAGLLDETGGERVMRSIAPQIGCPRRSVCEFLPLTKQDNRLTGVFTFENNSGCPESWLVEVERNFNLHAAIYRLAAGTHRRAHLPILHLGEGLFFQPEAGAFDDHGGDHPPVSRHRYVKQNTVP